MKPNAELQAQYAEFCQNMLESIAGGNPPPYGLCASLSVYRDPDNTDIERYQHGLFKERFGEGVPFEVNYEAYYNSRRMGTLYQNQARLAWLKEHAGVIQG